MQTTISNKLTNLKSTHYATLYNVAVSGLRYYFHKEIEHYMLIKKETERFLFPFLHHSDVVCSETMSLTNHDLYTDVANISVFTKSFIEETMAKHHIVLLKHNSEKLVASYGVLMETSGTLRLYYNVTF